MDRALVFDIDNTLTPPREVLEPHMAHLLTALSVPFALAAGSDAPLLVSQFFEPLHRFGFRGEFDAFVCNGASRYHCVCGDGLSLRELDGFSLQAHLGAGGFGTLMASLESLLATEAFALPAGWQSIGPRIVDRGSMVNLAPIGRPDGVLSDQGRALRQKFVAFDEATGYRRRCLELLVQEFSAKLPGSGLRVTYGGQTSFDIVVKGRDKSYAVRSMLSGGFKTVVYLGDALFPGGNDAAVLELAESWRSPDSRIDVVPVAGPEDTARYLQMNGYLTARPNEGAP